MENSAKTRLIERITEKPGEDGFSILSDYLAALNHGDRNRREGELRRLQNDAYLGLLVSRYPIGEMPAWVFLELSSFGAFADFYLFCANRWGDSGMRDEHYMLRRSNALRNAAAHSSAIVNGLGSPLSAPQLRHPAPLPRLSAKSACPSASGARRCAIRASCRWPFWLTPTPDSFPGRKRREPPRGYSHLPIDPSFMATGTRATP